MGSGEFEPWSEEAERALLSRSSGDGSVAILPLASAPEGEVFADWALKGLEHYASLGIAARVVEVKERGDAFRPELVEELERPSMIFFSGGTPAFLADAVAGSPLGEALTRALERGASLVGCSAGACLMGEAAPKSMTDDVVEHLWVQGLRLVPNVWIFPHWDVLDGYRDGNRDYFRSNVPADGVWIGVDERTILVGRGDDWRVFGLGAVVVGWRGHERAYRDGQALRLRAIAAPDDVDSAIAALIPPLPKGSGGIGLLSGDEFSPAVRGFDLALLETAGPHVAVLLAAGAEEAGEQWNKAQTHYRSLGAEAMLVPMLDSSEATPERLPEDFDVLFLGGGDPSRLISALAGTTLWSEAVDRWRGGTTLAGSSAGAMALCEDCLLPERGADVPTVWSRGLGPLKGMALAVHASSRPERWLEDVSSRAPCPVVVLDDGVGILLRPGSPPRAAGSGGISVAGPVGASPPELEDRRHATRTDASSTRPSFRIVDTSGATPQDAAISSSLRACIRSPNSPSSFLSNTRRACLNISLSSSSMWCSRFSFITVSFAPHVSSS